MSIIINGKVQSSVYSAGRVAEALPLLENEKEVFVLYDNSVEGFAQVLASQSPSVASTMGISVSEEDKDPGTVLDICDWLLSCNASRDALLLGMGGGILTDMAGFAASVYKRGIRFSFIPTTLLAQVDASIGGKTGVNFKGLKNMIGVIRQPLFVFECPEVLSTLPYGDFVGGSAEMLKTFIIEDRADNYRKAVDTLSKVNSSKDKAKAIGDSKETLLSLIHEAASVKAGVVGRDPYEKGERKNLNLGHTFAHAVESMARKEGTDISHGQAVAIGTVLSARLGEKLGISEKGLEKKFAEDFAKCGLPTECPFPLESLCEAMEKDKKAGGGKVRFIIPQSVGKVLQKDLSAKEALEKLV